MLWIGCEVAKRCVDIIIQGIQYHWIKLFEGLSLGLNATRMQARKTR